MKKVKRGPVIIDLNLPTHEAVKGEVQPAEPAKIPKNAEVKPAEEIRLADGMRELILGLFIDRFQKNGGVGFNELAYSIKGLSFDEGLSRVRSFIAQFEADGEIREVGKNKLGWKTYAFTEKGVAKYADWIIKDGSHEGILDAFIDLLKEGHEVDAEALAGRWAGYPAEVDAFLAHMLEIGEIENNDAGGYEFTKRGLDKFADRVFWYPSFRLINNPFSTFDAGTEHRAKLSISLIPEVPMVKQVKALISARRSAIIEGGRGCGKTSIISCFVNRADVVTAISPRNVESIKRAIRKRVASKIGPKGERIIYSSTLTQEESIEYRAATAEVGRGGHLLDAPDNLSHKATFELADLCARILDEGGFVILLATPEQARMLKRLDTFARFPVIRFERPPREFFRSLFMGRLDAASAVKTSRLPLTDGAIDRVADATDHNPRRFILLCSHLLTEMRERGMNTPLDEEMADELLKDADVLAEAPVDINETLRVIMRELGSSGTKWAKVKEIRAALAKKHSVDIRPETIGRRLTEMGYPRRYAPDAEYLVSG